jgi:uncharacterized membrane protein
VSQLKLAVGPAPNLTPPRSPLAGGKRQRQRVMRAAATIGVVAAGAAAFELALIPAIVIGGAAVLLPEYLPKRRDRVKPSLKLMKPPPLTSARAMSDRRAGEASPSMTQAVFKTVTFRIIVTSLDFSFNYVVLGELATAAGLSAFSLVAGPVFYFVHEAAWNRLGPPVRTGSRSGRLEVLVLLPGSGEAKASTSDRPRFAINRALAKTVTYRAFATVMEFATNYVVVGDVVTAAALSAFGFVVGPFVYYAHEVAWDRFGSPTRGAANALSAQAREARLAAASI